MKISPKIKKWRMRQRKGSIMKPETFMKIEKSAMKRYHIGKKRAAAIAGAAYWRSVKAKYQAR